MLKLRSSPPSPFGRKVKMSAIVLGLLDRIEIVATDTTAPDDPIRALNPLGKIPTLELEDGTTLFDSRVIVDYLDWLAGGGRLIPVEPSERFAALRGQALADGIMDAAILQIYEIRFRAEGERSDRWVETQVGKVARALDALEAATPPDGVRIDAIATASALGYLDLRFGDGWRDGHPRLADWHAAFRAAVPAYDKTAPH